MLNTYIHYKKVLNKAIIAIGKYFIVLYSQAVHDHASNMHSEVMRNNNFKKHAVVLDIKDEWLQYNKPVMACGTKRKRLNFSIVKINVW